MMGDEHMLITDNGCKPMACCNCKYHFAGEHWTYKISGVDHEDMNGFLCACFANEGTIIHMDGLANDTVDFCEMYKERGT